MTGLSKGNGVPKPGNDTVRVFVYGFFGNEEYWKRSNGIYWAELLKDELELQSSCI